MLARRNLLSGGAGAGAYGSLNTGADVNGGGDDSAAQGNHKLHFSPMRERQDSNRSLSRNNSWRPRACSESDRDGVPFPVINTNAEHLRKRDRAGSNLSHRSRASSTYSLDDEAIPDGLRLFNYSDYNKVVIKHAVRAALPGDDSDSEGGYETAEDRVVDADVESANVELSGSLNATVGLPSGIGEL